MVQTPIQNQMSDDDLMPFGKYKGTKMIDVPATYLLWLYDSTGFFKSPFKEQRAVKAYIEDNMQVLKKETK